MKNKYIAFSNSKPSAGQKCICTRINTSSGKAKAERVATSTIRTVELIGDSIYKADTIHSTYFVLVT